jgi:RNA polymerase sigma factor (TIGR02999 family)
MANSSAELLPPDKSVGAPLNIAECLPAFYDEMRRIARSRLAGGHYTMLDTTSLVHESFLRLRNVNRIEVKDAEHLLAYATSTMRSVVVDYVRQRKAARRGGGAAHESLDQQHEHAEELGVSDEEILGVHDALEALADVDMRLVRVVEMRYFGGLTDDEIGQALGVTDRTVRRDWDRAKLLLAGLLGR